MSKALMPIIGVNECGKTTILHALIAFDYINDSSNNGRQLEDVANLYDTAPATPIITATVEATLADLKRAVRSDAHSEHRARLLNSRKPFDGPLKIARNLKTKRYSIVGGPAFLKGKPAYQQELSRSILRRMPYILYFDDFQDAFPDQIEIAQEGSHWVDILETLFLKTDKNFSIYDLHLKEARQRKTILSRVQHYLNRQLTNEWRNFQLDDSDALEIHIEFEESDTRAYLKLDVVEKDANGAEHFFYVRDRSKGFYWFFNFVMKLEFNPKVVGINGNVDAIYVLDEPGSYLHALAQERLCRKLRQLADNNQVIYCTHSHHLLNPDVIPLSSVRVAEKSREGEVTLKSIYQHSGQMTDNRAAYQPLLDALQIRPFLMDLNGGTMILCEGIVDYYLLLMFKGDRGFRVLPSVGAPSIKFYISLMIAWRVDYRALWDNDRDGRGAYEDALSHFGKKEAEGRFFLLPARRGGAEKTIIQDLVDGKDVKAIRDALGLPGSGFDKTIATLFFWPDRDKLVTRLTATKANFDSLFETLGV